MYNFKRNQNQNWSNTKKKYIHFQQSLLTCITKLVNNKWKHFKL